MVMSQLLMVHLDQLHGAEAQTLQEALETSEVQAVTGAITLEQLRDVELLLLLQRDTPVRMGSVVRVILVVMVVFGRVWLMAVVALRQQERDDTQEAELCMQLDQHRPGSLGPLSRPAVKLSLSLIHI